MMITFLLSAALGLADGPARQGSAVPAPAPVGLEFAGFNDRGDVRLMIDRPSVEQLQRRSPSVVRLAISPVETISLDLKPFKVIAPDAKFLVAERGRQTAVAGPDVVFLRGTVVGEPTSHAFIALSTRDSGHGLGFVTRGNGDRWQIGSDRTDRRRSLVLTRDVGDAPGFDHFCTMIPLGEKNDGGGIAGLPDGASKGLRVLNVAIETDQRYWNLFADNQAALDYAAMVMGAVSDIYTRDLGLKIALRYVRLWPSGGEPVAADDLNGFRLYWQANEDMQGLNLVHLFSGARDTSYGGVAYVVDGCTQDGFGISAFMLGGFPAPITAPNLGNWDVNVVAHEMGHNLGTFHTHDYQPPVDNCANGTDERGTIMSYCHVRPGGLLNIDMFMHARTQDIIAAENPMVASSCLWHDCNGNLINDVEDIVFGASVDLNADGIPDECQDCNNNGILDPLDIVNGAPDVNANGVPDSCEIDCNGNAIPDRLECAQLLTPDLNGNRIPDGCEPDCNNNGIADFTDIALGTSVDLDRNSKPDECDDCNANGLADWHDVGREFDMFVGMENALAQNPVREYLASSGVPLQAHGGTDVQAAFDMVFGADRDLYVASFATDSIVRIHPDTSSTATFVVAGSGGLDGPSALAFGPDGRLYVASQLTNQILRYDGVSGAFDGVFVDSGVGGLAEPWDLAFDTAGNLLVLTNTAGVLKFDGLTGASLGVFASPTNLNLPRGMCLLADGRLLVTNRAGNNIRQFSSTGTDLGVWNDEYGANQPWGIAVGPNGNVYVTRRDNPVRIVEVTTSGRYLRSFIRGDSALVQPTSITFRPISPADDDGDMVLDVCEDSCFADIIPPPAGNGQVNTDELVAVVTSWGTCTSNPCIADIAPPGGNGQVDSDDLIVIITSWGSCP